MPIERHAEAIYTRAMYERFNHELYYSGSYAIKERSISNDYILAHFKEAGSRDERTFVFRHVARTKALFDCSY